MNNTHLYHQFLPLPEQQSPQSCNWLQHLRQAQGTSWACHHYLSTTTAKKIPVQLHHAWLGPACLCASCKTWKKSSSSIGTNTRMHTIWRRRRRRKTVVLKWATFVVAVLERTLLYQQWQTLLRLLPWQAGLQMCLYHYHHHVSASKEPKTLSWIVFPTTRKSGKTRRSMYWINHRAYRRTSWRKERKIE